jgi:peroxiredoxin
LAVACLADQPPDAKESKTTVIEGQVFNHYGAGVNGARVSVTRPPTGAESPPELATAATNQTGDFQLVIPEVVAGGVVVTVSAPGYATATRQVEIDPADEFPAFVDVELAGSGALGGLVRDARTDKPIAGATVMVMAVFRQLSADTDEQGAFTIRGLLPGEIKVMADAGGFGREQCQVMTRQGPGDRTELELPPPLGPDDHRGMSLDEAGRLIISLKPERICHVHTVDDKGKPVGGVLVECLDEARQDFRTLATDADGKLTIRGLNYDTRTLALRLSHEQYVSSEEFDRTVELPAEQLESSHTLTMQPAGVLTGTITDRATRRPLNGARVLVGSHGYDRMPRDWSDFEGRYRITGVSPGRQAVTVHLADHAPELLEIDVTAGETTTLDVKLDPASVVGGVVVDLQGQPIASAHVMAVQWRDHRTLGLQAISDFNGRFVIPNAPADEFLVTLRHVRYQPLENQAIQAPGTDHRFELTPGAGRGQLPEAKLKVGDDAPAFELTTLDGQKLRLADLKGKTVLLDFWATWCGPCVAEIPSIRAVFESFGQRRDFVLIGASLDQDRTALERFIKDRRMDWPQVFGREGGAERASDAYGVFAIPAAFLIGPDGKIKALDLRGPDLKTQVAKVLDQADML